MIAHFKALGRYVCPVCDERFALLSDKKEHMRTIHPRNAVEGWKR